MISVRPYRTQSFSIEEALQNLIDDAPQKYDRDIVNVFVSMINQAVNDTGARSKNSIIKALSIKKVDAKKNETDIEDHEHQRRYFRIPALLRLIYRKRGELKLGPPQEIVAHNISRSGVGLLSREPFQLNQNICITFNGKKNSTCINLTGVVVRNLGHGKNWCTVGVKLHKLIDENTLDLIVRSV